MKCLILAAGYATRLYPLTENFPKPLLKVGEKSILDWLVDDLVDTTDIDEFVVISNHKFAQHFEDWKSNKQKTRPYEITVIDDGTSTNETRLGAVKDIQLAVEKLNLADDLLVMAGDNVLDFSLSKFVEFAKEKDTSCVMCHVENELKKQQKTAIITVDDKDLITSYEEKPKEPKGNLAVPPFYCYRSEDVKRIQEALDNGCGYDAPGSFAAWLSKQTPIHAYKMPGKRYDIGDINSYVCTDPKGTIIIECGKMLSDAGYKIKVLNTINFKKSMHYNPFHYIRSEKDILKLVNTIIANTKGDGEKSGEDFWVKAERLLYCALIGYIYYEAPEEEQNFSTLLEFINASEAREDDEEFKNPVDELFEDLEKAKPEHFAVRQYKKYKLAAGDICSK